MIFVTGKQNSARFMRHLKIIDTFFKKKNSISIAKEIACKTQKRHLNSSSPCSTFWTIYQTIFGMFWSITQKLFWLLKLYCHFWVSHTIRFRTLTLLFIITVDNFTVKHAQIWFEAQLPLNIQKASTNVCNQRLSCPIELKLVILHPHIV